MTTTQKCCITGCDGDVAARFRHLCLGHRNCHKIVVKNCDGAEIAIIPLHYTKRLTSPIRYQGEYYTIQAGDGMYFIQLSMMPELQGDILTLIEEL